MKKLKTNAGFTIIIFLALLLMLTLAGINAVMTSTTEVDIAGNEMNYNNVFYAAESGLEIATVEIEQTFKTTGQAPDPLPSGQFIANEDAYDAAPIQVTYACSLMTASHPKVLTNGSYEGLYARATEYAVTSVGLTINSQNKAELKMIVENDLIPIYQFAVFYESDLEISPGPAMTLGGRVHSNGDTYIQSGNSIMVDSRLTSAGNIFHGPHAGSGIGSATGDVFIMDGSGNPISMYQSGDWIDANYSDWVDESQALWDGMVEDGDHGITELNMPVVRSGDPIDMIKTAAESPDSYENKATLKIIDGKAYQVHGDGSETNITTDLVSLGVISTGSMYDAREARNVETLDIDIAALNTSGYWPSNGIIYTAEKQVGINLHATRLVNGSTLSDDLTVSTKNPLYIHGDFNTVSKKSAAVMTDAMTILSNDWMDGDGVLPISDPNRQANRTEVNVSYMTGNVSSGGGTYSGGLENLPRFLENWNGTEFKWTGSAIDLWESQEATGHFSYGSYYRAPNRNWEFDTDLLDAANLPPGTPVISVVQRVGWREIVASR